MAGRGQPHHTAQTTHGAAVVARMQPDLAQLHAVLIMCLLIHVPIHQTKNV
ncbi:hypothetical protein HMPREF0168_1875 [Bifidobacterium dentium ATCC 27679]|uniref:Uncharacterized protein n=1 Tax=Bifidobacterium dentium ATCC 27679 TaxID=871562 RepID=E0Q9C9_9BIFI|nr:hypothetical protein HMPREF0168_1875 [Bifidobacterium dentium ATCC 27679]